MRRGARDSQIVNNFFTLASIVIISATLAIYVKYFANDEEKEPTIVVEKLQCEKEIFTSTKVFNQKLLNKSIKALDKGYYKLDGGYIEALKSKSKIKDIASLDELNSYFIESIGTKPKEEIEKYLTIKYEIIENDKKDLRNKRLNAGRVLTSFRINSNEIFRVNTDFTFLYKNAIKKRIDCSVKVFKNHVHNNKSK